MKYINTRMFVSYSLPNARQITSSYAETVHPRVEFSYNAYSPFYLIII